MNPPYKKLYGWVKKAVLEWKKGKTVVLLIPSRTDTRWWHDYVMQSQEIRFLRGRLKFDDRQFCAPFPSCIVVFRKGVTSEHPLIYSINTVGSVL